MGIPIIRTIIFRGLYWGSLILGKYHMLGFHGGCTPGCCSCSRRGRKLVKCWGKVFEPDYLFFALTANGFSSMTYAQALYRLRALLQLWHQNISVSQQTTYTLHPCKASFLTYMAELDLPERDRQGHHRGSSAQLYAREGTFPALSAQRQLWREFEDRRVILKSALNPSRP